MSEGDWIALEEVRNLLGLKEDERIYPILKLAKVRLHRRDCAPWIWRPDLARLLEIRGGERHEGPLFHWQGKNPSDSQPWCHAAAFEPERVLPADALIQLPLDYPSGRPCQVCWKAMLIYCWRRPCEDA